MTENQRLKILQNVLGFKTQAAFSKAIGLSTGTFSDIVREKPGVGVSANTKMRLEKEYNVNIQWLETGLGSQLLEKTNIEGPVLEAEVLHIGLDPDDATGEKFQDLGDGTIVMNVPVIPVKAYQGYMVGYQDPEFYEEFKTEPVYVQKEHKGHYLIFVLTGDSMIPSDPALLEHMALPGWKAVAREIPRHHWRFKLHTHKTDAWIIVHKTDGIVHKNIIKHDVEAGVITIHSLNPKYPDRDYHLDDIAQIFAVYKYIIDK